MRFVLGKVLLKDITTKIGSGATPRGGQSAYYSSGVSLIRSQNVLDFKFSLNGLAFINDEQAEKLKFVSVDSKDILLNITGDSIARTCLVPKNILPARVNQHVSIIRCKESIDNRYVHYYLQYLKSHLLQICGVGGTRNALTKEAVSKLEIVFQNNPQKIANILSTLDKKIELNNKINTELEAMAKTLYDYWFVQFDFPNAKGKPYKSSGGKMVYSEELKREIPEGWEVKEISELIEVKDGTHDSPKQSKSGQYLITSKHLKTSGIDFGSAYLISDEDFFLVNKRSKVEEGDLLFSMIGTVGLTHWVMDIDTKFAIKNIGLFKTSKVRDLADFLYLTISSSVIISYLKLRTSKGTSQPYLTLGTIRKIPIIMPPMKVLNIFNKKIVPINKKIYSNQKQTQTLKAQRDFLLPMLMNGQVSVK